MRKDTKKSYSIFLSVIAVVSKCDSQFIRHLTKINRSVAQLVSNYEMILVENNCDIHNREAIKKLVQPGGLPNLRIYSTIKEVHIDTAIYLGLQNAIGDYVIVIDPAADDESLINTLLDTGIKNQLDIVYMKNTYTPRQSIFYKIFDGIFDRIYRLLTGSYPKTSFSRFRLLTREVINFILRQPDPTLSYRQLPMISGFEQEQLTYHNPTAHTIKKTLRGSFNQGVHLLISSGSLPLRLVTLLSTFGALSNLVYTLYIILIGILKKNVAPGWISISLQQSCMFFLISLVLLILSEYILHILNQANNVGHSYITKEIATKEISHAGKLNLEEES